MKLEVALVIHADPTGVHSLVKTLYRSRKDDDSIKDQWIALIKAHITSVDGEEDPYFMTNINKYQDRTGTYMLIELKKIKWDH